MKFKVDFSTWKGRRAAHDGLPHWLNVYLACAYADSVPQGPEGRRAIDTARDWLRGLATADAADAAASAAYAAAAATAATAYAAYAAPAATAASAASSASYAAAAASAAYAAAATAAGETATYVAIYTRILQALDGWDLSNPECQQPALDWLEECQVLE